VWLCKIQAQVFKDNCHAGKLIVDTYSIAARNKYVRENPGEGITMQTTIQKWGNSLALRIPRAFIRESRLADKAVVDISVDNGKIIINPIPTKKYTLKELLKGVNKKNLHGEIDAGASVGEEMP
jgi:antitoxin MazE